MAEIAVSLATKQAAGLVGKLVDKLYGAISGELSLLLGVREEIQYIIDELEIMSAFLRGAEERQDHDWAARAWVKQVKQLAYAVEDCIDEFSLHLSQYSASHGFMPGLFNRARSLRSLQARHRIGTQIQSIKSRVEEVSKRRQRYGITQITTTSDSEDSIDAKHDPRVSALYNEETQLVGVEGPRSELVGWLLEESRQQLSLIVVVGPGGLGKTTIVRKAYESQDVIGGHFTCRAWITVSQVYHFEGLLRDMIIQLFSSPPRPEDLQKLARIRLIDMLRNHLKDKRYVVAFDDIWKTDVLKNLTLALPKNDLGSRIMLTTRKIDVAEMCCAQIPGHIYRHKKLSPEDSWNLFCRRVFLEPTCPKEIEVQSRKILEKCDGLPLAIVSIAGVLASKPKKTSAEWKKILDHLGSELESDPNLEAMSQMLSFSYNDLPYHAKYCFLYLSKFPEDSLIKRKRIQRLWIAEGFIEGRHDMTVQEVAESYFNELVNRGMILPSTFNYLDKVDTFRVHDIMLELIVSKSREDNFVSVLGKNSTWTPQDVIRRLSVHADYSRQNMSLSHVKSLSVFGSGWSTDISPLSRMLRVLDLEGCDVLCNHHLEVVGKLLHLKYLSLRNNVSLTMLPESIVNLRNLETLDIRETNIRELPAGIIKLQQLRFLFCEVRLSRGIGGLRNLQILRSISVWENNKGLMKQLATLTQLRKLAVKGYPEESGRALRGSLSAMSSSLRSLNVISFRPTSFMNVLTSPPLLLESLKLEGLSRLLNWVGLLSNVVKISLRNCEDFGDDAIKVLGTLPSLIRFELLTPAYKEQSLHFDGEGYPSLKALYLTRLPVRSLHFGEGAMRHLELVSVSMAYQALNISGIKHVPRLKQINLIGLYRADFDAIQKQVDELMNRPRPRLTTSDIKEDLPQNSPDS